MDRQREKKGDVHYWRYAVATLKTYKTVNYTAIIKKSKKERESSKKENLIPVLPKWSPPSKCFLWALPKMCSTSIRYRKCSDRSARLGFHSPLPPTPYRCVDLDESDVGLLVHVFNLGVKRGSALKLHLRKIRILSWSYTATGQAWGWTQKKTKTAPPACTLTRCLLATTWALVTMSPSSDTTKPEPLATATSRLEKAILSRGTGSVNVK